MTLMIILMMIESGSVLIRLERPVKQEGTQTLGHSDVWHLKSSSQIITIVSSLLSKLLNGYNPLGKQNNIASLPGYFEYNV